jgi:hypothetical protein
VFVIPPFALEQKVEPKNQGKPEPLRASCQPRTAAVIIFLSFTNFAPSSLLHYSLQLFQKAIPFLLV